MKTFPITGDLLLAVLESTPFGIIAFSKKGSIQWINDQALNFLKIDASEKQVIGQDISSVLHEPFELSSQIKNVLLQKEKAFDLEGLYFKKKYLTFRGRITQRGMIITIADISTVKKAELQSLNSMLEGQEMERKRLSREIHDGIGPLLSTLKMNLGTLDDEKVINDEKTRANLHEAYELIDEISDDLRSISYNLLPKVLLDFGLAEALETLKDKIGSSKNVKISVFVTGLNDRLDQVTELAIYRIFQELINNTLKHAKATKITLQLIHSDNKIRLLYEDNGMGFSYELTSKGLGLMNIENRIKALGGKWHIDSTPGRGMTASIEFPIVNNEYGEH